MRVLECVNQIEVAKRFCQDDAIVTRENFLGGAYHLRIRMNRIKELGVFVGIG